MNNDSSLFKDTLFYSIANWGRRIVTLITAPVIIAYLTPSDYGYISLVTTVASFFSILGLLAVADQGLARFFIDTENIEDKRGYAASSVFISSLGMLGVTLFLLIFIPFIPRIFDDIRSPGIFMMLILLVCLTQSISYVGSNLLKWSFRSPLFAKISLFHAVFGAILTISGVIFLDFQARHILIVTIVTSLLSGLLANYAVREYYNFSYISKGKMKELFLYSWPLLGLNIFAFFTRSLDRIFLGSMASLGDLGIFSVSSTVASVFETLVSGFFFAWGPYVLSSFRDHGAPEKFARYFSAVAALGIICIIVLGLWGSPLLKIIRPDNSYIDIGIYIPWIISGSLLYYLGGYFAPGPAIKKQTYWKLIAFMISAMINAVLNFVLIPVYGVLGAGIATTAASLAAGIFNQSVSNRMYYVPNRWRFSFFYIIAFTIISSIIQKNEFAFNINGMSLLGRGGVTLVFLIAGILPFIRDINESGILLKAYDRIRGVK